MILPKVNSRDVTIPPTIAICHLGFPSGRYIFLAQADDGIRVFVDGVRVINGWRDQSATSYLGYRWMTSGEHTVVVEYYEHGGDAVTQQLMRAITEASGLSDGVNAPNAMPMTAEIANASAIACGDT